MAQSSIWWLLAGGAIAIELLTGTFYLLMLGIGFVAAALVAHGGATPPLQVAVAALVGVGSVLVWRRFRLRHPVSAPASINHDVNLDIGGVVQVVAWQPDGTGTVKYRGAQWSVSHSAGDPAGTAPTPGAHRIVEVIGSVLVVEKI